MPKVLKYALVSLAAVAGLLVIAGAILAATFDPNDYKSLIIERVQQDRQRTLAIPGDIELRFFPNIGVQLGAVSLSEHGSAETFASVQSARVSLAVLPLLRKQVVVDRVKVEGLRAKVTRYQNGRTSIDDLLRPPEKKAQEPAEPPARQKMQFDVAGLSITDASITIDDLLNRRNLELTKADIETGRIAPGTAGDASFKGHVKANQPPLDADLGLKGNFLLDPSHRRYAFSKLSVEVTGRVATLADAKLRLGGNADVALEPLVLDLNGIELTVQGQDAQGLLEASVEVPQLKVGEKDITARKIVAKASLKQGRRALLAQLSLPSFSGSAHAFKLPAIDGELSVDDGPLHAKARLAGAIDGDMSRLVFSSAQSTLVLDGKQGDTEIKGTLATPWVVDLKAQTIELSRIAAEFALPNPKGGTLALNATGGASVRLDRDSLEAKLAGRLDESAFNAMFGMSSFTPATYDFDVRIDRIDVDRYRAPSRPAKDGGAAAAPETSLDLAALRELNAAGSLRVGTLKVAGIKANNLRLDLRASGSRLDLSPLDAELYQGRVAGSLSLVAGTPPRLSMKQSLSGISIGPLLKDALGKESLEGRSNVVLDVTTQGATVTALPKALNGSARVELRDGAVRGFNIAQAIRSASAKLGGASGQHAGTGSQSESTDFSELSGGFRIAHGVAHNDDLLAKSPLLRVTGNGDIDLGEGRLDYVVKATVVGTLQGQGGPELQSLRGQTVPIRLNGPFTAIGYSIDFAGLVQEMAKQKIEEEAKEATAKAQQHLGEKLKGLLGK